MQVHYGAHRCVEVDPGLLLGSVSALKHIKKLSVTHVLSVFNFPFYEDVSNVHHLHIKIADVDEANLLEILERAHAFIDEGLKTPQGRILVHCYAGMSRSVSVVLAYLMKKMQLDVDATLHHLDARYPHACPNAGFLHQLQVFYESSYDYHQALSTFCKKRGYRNESRDDIVEIKRTYPDGYQNPTEIRSEKTADKKLVAPDFSFECRKCHISLGDSTSVHNVMNVDILQESGSMFVEQLDWMEIQTSKAKVSGKLYCPNCNEKLGSFNWAGISDGAMWFSPGFQLHLSKLDVRSYAADMETIVHRPKLLSLNDSAERERNGHVIAFDFVVFDCDGVLVNTEVSSCESLYRCIRDATGFEIPRSFPDDYYEVFGMDVRSCLEHYKKKYALDWEDMDAITEKALVSKEQHYHELTLENGIPPFDGVASLIKKLQQHRIPYGVASSGHPTKIKRNLEESGLVNLFDPRLVVSASEVARGKPAPDVYLEAFSRIGCKDCPSKCVVIEDSISGLKAARSAGAFGIGITNSLPRSLLAPHADLVINHISELERSLPVADEIMN